MHQIAHTHRYQSPTLCQFIVIKIHELLNLLGADVSVRWLQWVTGYKFSNAPRQTHISEMSTLFSPALVHQSDLTTSSWNVANRFNACHFRTAVSASSTSTSCVPTWASTSDTSSSCASGVERTSTWNSTLMNTWRHTLVSPFVMHSWMCWCKIPEEYAFFWGSRTLPTPEGYFIDYCVF